MKFKHKHTHKSREKTLGQEVSEAWQDTVLPIKNYKKSVVKKEVRKR